METDMISTVYARDLDASQLRDAFQRVGAIRLLEMLDPMFVHQVMQAARKVFSLPRETLDLFRRHGMSSGYTPPGIEGVRGNPGDMGREFWDIVNPCSVPVEDPNEVDWFVACGSVMYWQCEALLMDLLQLLDQHRAASDRQLAADARGGRHSVRINHYFTSPEAGMVIFPRHLDFGLITLYIGGASRGLEHLQDGVWRPVQNPLGSVIAGCGTTLRQFEPAFKSFCHRVVSIGEERISLVAFSEPRAEIPLPNGKTAGEHLERLVRLIRKE